MVVGGEWKQFTGAMMDNLARLLNSGTKCVGDDMAGVADSGGMAGGLPIRAGGRNPEGRERTTKTFGLAPGYSNDAPVFQLGFNERFDSGGKQSRQTGRRGTKTVASLQLLVVRIVEARRYWASIAPKARNPNEEDGPIQDTQKELDQYFDAPSETRCDDQEFKKKGGYASGRAWGQRHAGEEVFATALRGRARQNGIQVGLPQTVQGERCATVLNR